MSRLAKQVSNVTSSDNRPETARIRGPILLYGLQLLHLIYFHREPLPLYCQTRGGSSDCHVSMQRALRLLLFFLRRLAAAVRDLLAHLVLLEPLVQGVVEVPRAAQ